MRAAVVDRVQGADLVARVRQERGDHLEVPDHDQGRGAARPHREGPLHGHVAGRISRGESHLHSPSPSSPILPVSFARNYPFSDCYKIEKVTRKMADSRNLASMCSYIVGLSRPKYELVVAIASRAFSMS